MPCSLSPKLQRILLHCRSLLASMCPVIWEHRFITMSSYSWCLGPCIPLSIPPLWIFLPTSSSVECTGRSPGQRSSTLSLSSPFMLLFSLVHTHMHTHIRAHMHTHTCKFSTRFVNFPVLKKKNNSLSPWGFVPFFASLHIKTSKNLCLYSFPALLSHFFGTHRIKALSPGIPSKSSVQGHWWLPLLGYMY